MKKNNETSEVFSPYRSDTQKKPVRLLRRAEVEHRTAMSKSTMYAAIANREFPEPVKTGRQSVRWIESEIDDYLTAQVLASRRTKVLPVKRSVQSGSSL